MELDRVEISRLTEQYGGTWGINHTKRLLLLVDTIGQGMRYNQEALWLAAHLHDWGAYAPWAQPEVDHCLRAVQVADPFLSERGCPDGFKDLVLECILLHHTQGTGSDRSIESVLLRDADALDFLGVVGVLRNFSMNPRDLRMGYQETKRRQAKMSAMLSLEKSRDLAAKRVADMDEMLRLFEVETTGCF